MEQIALMWEPVRRLLTVSELNSQIRTILDKQFNDVWVAGEISGVKLAASGHYYFTLKDDSAQLRCVCFRTAARLLKFKPQDGIAVLARGRLDVYEARGEYQLLVETIEPQGHGALQLAFDQLKKKLTAEGLFARELKRPLPKFPSRIGVVTSPTGAVIRDILDVLGRRFPGLHIRLYPALVQGEGSINAVCRGIEYFSESKWAEVVIVARGGGSLEDLWTFNEEQVARAIVACTVPVISAIGHETDFTIADFVADLRAPTPSAAAELVICTREQLYEQIQGCRGKLEQLIRYRLSMSRTLLYRQGIQRTESIIHRAIGRSQQRVDELGYTARELLTQRLRQLRERRDDLAARLQRKDLRVRFASARHRLEVARRCAEQSMTLKLSRDRSRYQQLAAHLNQLSPVKILERGYAIVHDDQGRLVRDAAGVAIGSGIDIKLGKGSLRAEVKRTSASPNEENSR